MKLTMSIFLGLLSYSNNQQSQAIQSSHFVFNTDLSRFQNKLISPLRAVYIYTYTFYGALVIKVSITSHWLYRTTCTLKHFDITKWNDFTMCAKQAYANNTTKLQSVLIVGFDLLN